MAAVRPIVIYSRKSKFTGKGESIENQIEMCRQYIRLQFGDDAAEQALVYEDEGFSGGTLARPQFKKMMADAIEKNFRAIVVYRLDRISRNIGDFAKLIEQLNRMKIDFISIKEQFDTSSPMGRAMMYISSVFSQLERETIAERIRDNMHELSKTGRWLGGNTPTGYESESVSHVTIDGKTKRACKLKILPEEIGIVKLIYDKFLETGSLTKTETYLLQNGYTTKNGKQFTRFAVKGILSNPVYLIADEFAYDYLTKSHVDLFAEQSDFDGVHGIMAYNRTLQQPGRAHQIKPMEEWIVSVGKHQGVIEGKAWVKVQTILERNKSKSYRKPRSNVALLSGLLVCGNCGEYMRPKLSKRRNTKGEFIYTYLCSMKERSRGHVCNMKNCNGNMLDADIIEQLKHLSEDGSDFIRQLEQSKRALLGNRQSYDAEISNLESEIAANEEEIKCLVSALGKSSGTSAESYIMQQIDELHAKGEGLKRHLAELKELTSSHALADIEFDLLAQMLSTFKDTVDKMTVEQKRAAIRTFVKEIIWDGRDAHVVLFGSEYEYEFPKTPAGIGKQVAGGGTEVNFHETTGRGNVEPLGEDSKYYPNIAELSKDEVAKQAPFGAKWRLLAQVEVRCYILISNISGSVKVAPLQILQFPVILPHKFQDAEKFNLQFSDFSEITETADKLRWLRYQKGLRQRDVADYAGIYRSTYIHYEEYGKDFYSPKHMEKIAQLFEVPVERLLDDYNLFLRNGQGKQIKAIRMKLGLTQREYADRLGISLCNLKQWEQNRKQLFKSTWEKYFK